MTKDWIQPPHNPPLRGDEVFKGVNASVRDFWAFAMSDLRMNNVRGYLAEFLVARAVGASNTRIEWDAYDILSPDGIRIEVKSSGYLQAWAQPGLSRISFGSLKGRTLTADGGQAHEATLNADVYVFSLQTATSHEAYDPLDVAQWEFYVLNRATIAATGRKSMGLLTLRALTEGPLSYDRLADAIRAAGET